ncbi:hypothetical protein BKP45_15275 [Anaerobacillus alkalidiazotrophicus]|uniref:DUF5626 domain-containing protein n=1 Tax=Anaerobacillus alkalidiazotrophicus TaxID=472963 RepID=A0A1S2M2C9_9BACI|nr:hypothetical protein [Anaerobacillus alkalidiazotrophicus]OIJ18888.1 hypothetical protein BKP45_15275 [Anaerobacillus alkalidiazotrophicus]
MKLVFKIGLLLFPFILPATVLAQETSAQGSDQVPPPTIGEPKLEDQESIEGEFNVFTQSYLFLNKGYSFISNNNNGTVNVNGSTSAKASVNTIVVHLYLQRWDAMNGRWVDVINIGEYKNYYSSSVSGSRNVIAPGGYYYRTKATHWLSQSGMIEQSQSFSSYIFVE